MLRLGLSLLFILQVFGNVAGAQVIRRGESFLLNGSRVKILRAISEGQYGKVYRAELNIGGEVQVVAVKPFFASRYSAESLQQIKANYTRLQALTAKGIVGIRSIGYSEVVALDDLEYDESEAGSRRNQKKSEALLVVMDYFDRDLELAPLAESASSSEFAQRLKLVENLVSSGLIAIKALARQGLVHGDLKPANFLLNAKGEIALADLDHLVKASGASSGESEFRQEILRSTGTAGFTPPEFWQERGSLEASDLYSLSMTALQLLTGRVLHDLVENNSRLKPLSAEQHRVALREAVQLVKKYYTQKTLDPEMSKRVQSVLDFMQKGLSFEPTQREAIWPQQLQGLSCSRVI